MTPTCFIRRGERAFAGAVEGAISRLPGVPA